MAPGGMSSARHQADLAAECMAQKIRALVAEDATRPSNTTKTYAAATEKWEVCY